MSIATGETEVSNIGGMIYHYERALIMEWVTLKSLFPVLFVLFTFDCLTMLDFSCLNISVRCHIKSAGVSKMFTEGQKETFERYLSEKATGIQLKYFTSAQMALCTEVKEEGSAPGYRQFWVLFLNSCCSQWIYNQYIGLDSFTFTWTSTVIWNAWWYPDCYLYARMFHVSFPALSGYLGHTGTLETAPEV